MASATRYLTLLSDRQGRPQPLRCRRAGRLVRGWCWNPPGHANGCITPRQLDAIWKVGRAKGLDPDAVGHMSLRVFNRKPDALTRDEASNLIKELSNLKRRVA